MGETSNKPVGAMLAVSLIALGVMSLMGANLLWPLFILVPGLMMLAVAVGGGRAGAASMAIPGMIIAGTGALMFIQNLTNYWESWSYAWTLYGAFLGLGFMLMGRRLDDPSLHGVGEKFVNASLLAFAGFAFLFEIVFGISGNGPRNALVLIALGVFLLVRGATRDRMKNLISEFADGGSKPKRNLKTKRDDDPLFTGPIVYGTRVASRSTSRLSTSDAEELPGHD